MSLWFERLGNHSPRLSTLNKLLLLLLLLSDTFGDIGLLNCDPVKITLEEDPNHIVLIRPGEFLFHRCRKSNKNWKGWRKTRWLLRRSLSQLTGVRLWFLLWRVMGKWELKKERLNEAVKREKYMLPNPEDVAPELAGTKIFSKLDTSSWFWQIPLHESCAKLTTFITPSGPILFPPFAIWYHVCPRNLPTMYEPNVKESRRNKSHHGWHHHLWLDNRGTWWKAKKDIRNNPRIRCEAKQIQMWNRKRELSYFDHIIGEKGISPDPAKIQA